MFSSVGKIGNIVSVTKMFVNLLGNMFVSKKANFVSATMFPGVSKQENINRKHNVSAQGFIPREIFNCTVY